MMRDWLPALVIGVVAGVIADAVGVLATDFGEISNGDILSIIQIVLLVYLMSSVRKALKVQDTTPGWRRWLP